MGDGLIYPSPMTQPLCGTFKSPRYHRWRSFLLREKFENRARLEVKAFVVVDGKDLNSRIGLYAQRRLDLMRRPLGRPSAPP